MAKQQRLLVAIQGEGSSYSHQALLRAYGEGVDPLFLPTLEQVFQALEDGQADEAIVALENSFAGPVDGVAALLEARPVRVIGDVWHPVHHCLLALPGQTLAEITHAMSHPQALAQCSAFLSTLHVELIPAADTAGSARLIWERGWNGVAAIASRRAAEVYGLTVLDENIQTRSDNRTHFLLLAAQLPLRDVSRHPLRSPDQRVIPGGALCR
jgi:prephenate dehydratase